MKNNMMFGLLASSDTPQACRRTNSIAMLLIVALLASVSFAQPVDYDKFVRTGACLRSTIDTGGLMTTTYPQGNFEEYGEMEFDYFAAKYYVNYEAPTCPKENGVSICA